MEKNETSKVILVIITGLLVLAYIFEKDKSSDIYSNWFVISSASIAVLYLLFPIVGELIVKVWFKIGHVLGWINTRILLTLVFYLILFPISMIYRMFNKNSLQRKRSTESIFIERNHLYQKKDLENIW